MDRTAPNGEPADGPARRAATADAVLPADITVPWLLRRAAREAPDTVALVDTTADVVVRWTYRSLLDAVERCAAGLHSAMGGEIGGVDPDAARHALAALPPRVAIWAPSSAEWLIANFAAGVLGLVVVPVNPNAPPAEAVALLERTRPSIVVHSATHGTVPIGDTVAGWASRLGSATALTIDRIGELASSGAAAVPAAGWPDVPGQHPAQVQFTSGTTGRPKGVVLHHRGLAGMPFVAMQLLGLDAPPVWLNVMPMFHIGGCGISTLGPMAAFGTQVIADRFSAARALETIEAERVTVMGTVPTMVYDLLGHPDRPGRDLGSLRVLMSGGANVAAQMIADAERELGVRVVVAFGQTEAHGHVSQTRPSDDVAAKTLTVGRPLPFVEVAVKDPEGSVVARGELGEIRVAGPFLMHGYLDDDEATAAAFDAEAMLCTGDVGALDGRDHLLVVGRLKELISRGGESISPREIEERLLLADDVAQVAVVGRPDERLGERVVAFVRAAPGADLDAARLSAWVAGALAPAKVPAEWFVVDEFPVTGSGKVRKHLLGSGDWPSRALATA